MTGSISDLTIQPDEPQLRLIEVVYQGFGLTGEWPIYQYVEAVMFRRYGLDAEEVLADCPHLPGRGRYGWFWNTSPTVNSAPAPDDKVGLTVAGMARLPLASPIVEQFLQVLRCFTIMERKFVPSPTAVQVVTASATDVRKCFTAHSHTPPSVVELSRLREVTRNEPSTWSTIFTDDPSGMWVAELKPFLRPYSEVKDAQDYLNRLADTLGRSVPPVTSPPSRLPDMALAEAFDYLNVVWRLRMKTNAPLFPIPRAEAAAGLARQCHTKEDFDSRVSSLALILNQVAIPRRKQSSLLDAQVHLIEVRPLAADLVERSITALRAVMDLRAFLQHPADRRLQPAVARLGLVLPTSDWDEAWCRVQFAVWGALSGLREAVDAGD